MPERLVVIGGDAAGLSAATNARRSRPPGDLEIVVFERGDWISFSACGEPYFVAGIVDPVEALLALSEREAAERSIEVRKRCEVIAIDTATQTVTVRDHLAAREEVVGYDLLMYATGASARQIPLEGARLRGVFHMHTLDDAIAARAAVEDGVRRAVIVGGGYVGIEMAEAFHHRGIHTTIVSAEDTLLAGTFDESFALQLMEQVRSLGIDIVAGERVGCLSGVDGHVRAVGCDGDTLPADIVIVAAGTVPNVELARNAGLRLGETGAVWVDDHQRASVSNVYAGGDCAESVHRLSGRPVNIHLGTYANRQGRVAGLNIGGGDEVFPGVLGTAIAKVMDIEIARTGLTEQEARGLGRDVVVTEFEANTAAGYWPESRRMRMRVIGDRGSRQVLGAQIFGGRGAGKRIDAMAMAIWNEMTADDLVNADLSYAPPFSGVWDPVLHAARLLQSVLDRA
ncbi:MAG: FAD-dependent oxidoreductase [Dehalococcoidia bacterium]